MITTQPNACTHNCNQGRACGCAAPCGHPAAGADHFLTQEDAAELYGEALDIAVFVLAVLAAVAGAWYLIAA